jgi:hypothetical protein
MLNLVRKAPASHADRVASSDYFESLGSVFQSADGEKIAVHTSGMWHGPAGVYLSIDLSVPVNVFFHNPELGQSEKFGPIPSLRIVNGSMWEIREPPSLIAHFDDARQAWHIFARPAVIMPRFTIRPA